MRSLITTILVLLILLTFSFVVIKAGSLGEDDNWFNKSLRQEFAKSIFLRNTLSLNNPGDAVNDYLADRTERIIIEVDAVIGLNFERSVLEQVQVKVAEITGKTVDIRLSSNIASAQNALGQEELSAFSEQYRNSRPTKTSAVLYVLLASRSSQNAEQIGSTLGADGAVIFADAIDDLPADPADLQVSTLLHEFVHLLGIGHIEQPRCIMNEAVEVGRLRSRSPAMDFCPAELQLINQVKANINN